MPTVFASQPPLEQWHWMGLCIRLALYPNEPSLIQEYLWNGRKLHAADDDAQWRVATEAACLLLDCAADRALPLHWRGVCVDNLYRPLHQLAGLARSDAQRAGLSRLQRRLARLDISPAGGPL